MKIVSVVFDFDSRKMYEKLAKVLRYSAEKYCPDAEFELIKLPPPKLQGLKRSFVANTVKIDHWLRVLKSTSDNVVFMDCDMVILKDLSDAFDDQSFDVGYCVRDTRRSRTLPMNGGLVFVRNNKAGIDFIEQWKKVNDLMFQDIVKTGGRELHKRWRQKYAGMNQAAFGYLFEKGKYNAKLKKFKCSIWNICIEDWPNLNESSRVIHIKSRLRKAVLCRNPTSLVLPKMRKAVSLWRELAQEAGMITADNNTIIGLKKPVIRKKIKISTRRSRYLKRYC